MSITTEVEADRRQAELQQSLARPETHGIDFIPEGERHGRPFSLFTLWFGTTAMMATVVTGGAIAFPGMWFGWYIIAFAAGTTLGCFLAAFHAAQGPTIGIPQMIQTRAQFGYAGGAFPMLIVLLSWFTFLPATTAIFAEMLSDISPISAPYGVLICMIIATAIALWGYDLIHDFARWIGLLSILTLGAATVIVFATHAFGIHATTVLGVGGFNTGLFLGALGLAFIYAAGYSGGVADYSRYLPRRTSNLRAGLWTGLGIGVPTFWLFVVGAYLVLVAKSPDPVAAMDTSITRFGGTGLLDLVYAVGCLALIAQAMLIVYVGANTTMAVLDSLRLRRHTPKPSFGIRAAHLLPFAALGLILGEIATGRAAAFITTSLGYLLVLIIPWSAINLADFYLVRKGQYSVADIFDPRGRYGIFNRIGAFSYLLALLCEVPFINVSGYESPVAKLLGGGDISWVIGIPIGVACYTYLMRRAAVRPLTGSLSEENAAST